ncbi:MAG: DUF2784 domain-containing protein [Terriglobales bacterium]
MSALWIALATLVVFVHALFILWVAAGAALTRGRRWLRAAHLASLAWAVLVDIGPWPCPLTALEQFLENAAGLVSYRGSFLLHYLQLIVYPNLPDSLIVVAGLTVCGANFFIYFRRAARSGHSPTSGTEAPARGGRAAPPAPSPPRTPPVPIVTISHKIVTKKSQ